MKNLDRKVRAREFATAPWRGIARTERMRFGDYVLVARLSQDALGTVFRAIHERDGRFARLRLLESPELPREVVLAAIRRRDTPHRSRSFYPPGRRETLGIAEDRPYLAWRETSGWTLDAIFESMRRAHTSIPIEGAARLVAGAAHALEHARATVVEGQPVRHGLVWPGFVTVSRNAEVWVRGFGLAPAVLPSLVKPRLSELIAPYIAPEVRDSGVADVGSDVYSLGVLLLELITGRSPSQEGRLADFAPADPYSQDVAALARWAIADSPLLRPSLTVFRERLERLIADCPYEGSPADLSLWLDDLLGPERVEETPRQQPTSPFPRPAPARKKSPEPRVTKGVWALRIAAALSAVAMLAAVDLAIHRRKPSKFEVAKTHSVPTPRSTVAQLKASPPQTGAAELSEALPLEALPAIRSPGKSRASLLLRRQLAELAEVWRLRAALARVSAERIDASNLASESFRLGRIYEREGARLLALRKSLASRESYERAADFYIKAEELSHQERARVISLSGFEERSSGVSRPF